MAPLVLLVVGLTGLIMERQQVAKQPSLKGLWVHPVGS
jgi:hypothetical protein